MPLAGHWCLQWSHVVSAHVVDRWPANRRYVDEDRPCSWSVGVATCRGFGCPPGAHRARQNGGDGRAHVHTRDEPDPALARLDIAVAAPDPTIAIPPETHNGTRTPG